MKRTSFCFAAIPFYIAYMLLPVFVSAQKLPEKKLKFPYKKEGLTKRQAAAHLISRFSYGATPGQIDAVAKMGLEKWFLQQLDGHLPDDSLNKRLDSFPDIYLSNTEVLAKYPPGFVVVSMAIKDSVISKDSVNTAVNKKAYNDTIQAYMVRKGLKSDQQLYKQFISQHIIRAAYSNNQMREVMTDFWFNHFNVSFTKAEAAQFIPAYERDVIRPNVFGQFDKLLIASAKSPAMLYFLDNFTSACAPPPSKKVEKPQPAADNTMMMADAAPNMAMAAAPAANNNKKKKADNKNLTGLNENYAREVMELHTMGVDGGYTQSDVTQAARVLTGWTIYPISSAGYGSAMKGLVSKIGEGNLEKKGFVREGDFLYTPTRHDDSAKTILGKYFPPKGGYQEGMGLLEMLAHHPSTAKFICKKLATRFVSDSPSASLIQKMAATFTETNGNIAAVLVTMVNAREFWQPSSIREKVKSPFELAISAVRGLDADVRDPYQLFNWASRMGQKIYYYQAPTGFPDRGQFWINSGSLLSRMNFGVALATQKINGISINLAALNKGKVPKTATDALETYSKLLMPERNLDATYQELTPLLAAPNLAKTLYADNNTAKPKPNTTPAATAPDLPTVGATGDMMQQSIGKDANYVKPVPKDTVVAANTEKDNENKLMRQVVGIIIGSPEFQRR